jgi:predicted ATPase
MWIKSLRLTNIRSFADATLRFSKGINVLVGPNNSGKSTILRPLMALQSGFDQLSATDIRIGQEGLLATIEIGDPEKSWHDGNPAWVWFQLPPKRNEHYLMYAASMDGQKQALHRPIPNQEPHNFIYPFLSKRKVTKLSHDVKTDIVCSVAPTFEHLNAKIDRLSSPEFVPAHDLYMRACKNILGFKVTAASTSSGKMAVYTVRNLRNIPLLAMGEGVMNILGMVVNLAMAEGKLFLIEEPENDLHPRALKALMDLVIEKAKDNQFIVTTHSNIVLKQLGAAQDAKVFRVAYSLPERLPTSTVSELDNSAEARREILEDMGYELHDIDLFDAWLLFEEATAERIVREFLIPWFAPNLSGRLRTYSAHSVSEVGPKFRDLNDLLVFLHLEPVYKNRAWVLVDAGKEEKAVIDQLRDTYAKSGWKADQFRQLSQHDFERYYPANFQDEVTRILAIPDTNAKQKAKKELLDCVIKWIGEDDSRAKSQFEESAREVIAILKDIETALKPQTQSP